MDTQGTITVGKPVPSKAERIEDAEYVLDFVERSDRYRTRYLSNWREMLENYMVVPAGSSYETTPRIGAFGNRQTSMRRGRSVLKDTESHQIVESAAAQALGLMFGTRDYLQAVPRGSDDYEKARLLSRLLMAVLESPGTYRTLYQAWKDSFIFGTSYLEFSWERRFQQQVAEAVFIDPQTGQPIKTSIPQQVLHREGPLITQLDGWKAYPDPNGTRIHHDMIGFAKEFRITAMAARALSDAGVYDKSETNEALKPGASPESKDKQERFPYEAKSAPKGMELYRGFEYWGTCPGNHADGASDRVVTVLEGRCVRDTINPHQNGMIPFKEIVVNPMTGRHYGLSPLEVNRYLQDSADQMLMLLSDAADDMVHPVTLIGGMFQGNPDELYSNKRYIKVMGDIKQVAPLQRDYSALTVAAQELMRRKIMQRESSGRTDPTQAIPSSDRTTATEVSELIRLASQRTQMQVQMSERDDMPFVGGMIHSMLRQFGSPDGFIASLNGEPLEVPFESIDIDADVRFFGSGMAESKFQKIAAYERAITTISNGIPLIPMMPDLFVRYLRDGLQIEDAKEILVGAMRYTAMASMQGAGPMQATPSAPVSSETNFGTEAGQTEKQGRRVA